MNNFVFSLNLVRWDNLKFTSGLKVNLVKAVIVCVGLQGFANVTNCSAMDLEDTRSGSVVTVPRVSTKERLEFAKEQLTRNPGLTMWDKISKELWSFYERDKAFILEEAKKRKNHKWIASKVEELEGFIKEKAFDQKMSFAEYTFIGYAWANILTVARVREQTVPEHFISQDYENLENYEFEYGPRNSMYHIFLKSSKSKDSIEECYASFEKASGEIQRLGFVEHEIDIRLKFLGTSGIVLPHISQTGIVPILSFNKGWGFFTTSEEDRASYVDFLAVGTNSDLEWDSTKDASCLSSWAHDVAHMGSSSRFKGSSNAKPLGEAFRVARLRKSLEAGNLSKIEWSKAELAFYEAFRERTHMSCPYYTFGMFLEDQIKAIEKDLENHTLHNIGRFENESQADFNVRAARSLDIQLEGSNALEKQRPFLEALRDGFRILQEHSSAFDL